jgi:hypothetical protein
MASRVILCLSWDDDIGEAKINFQGMDKLYGIEKSDFLDDVIYMLEEYRAAQGISFFNDYLDKSE